LKVNDASVHVVPNQVPIFSIFGLVLPEKFIPVGSSEQKGQLASNNRALIVTPDRGWHARRCGVVGVAIAAERV
jgi:hypothetical protein